jgi:hypothetical protein
MSKYTMYLMMATVAMLTNSCSASNVPSCDVAQIERVLMALDAAQKPPSSSETLRALFEPTARVIAVSPAKTYDRSAEEFIAEKTNSTDPAPLAYAFETARITCDGERFANVVRRGCQVAKQDNDIFEFSQTEKLELAQTSDSWLIHSMTSSLDAMSANGRPLFENQPQVKLESCTRAAASR